MVITVRTRFGESQTSTPLIKRTLPGGKFQSCLSGKMFSSLLSTNNGNSLTFSLVFFFLPRIISYHYPAVYYSVICTARSTIWGNVNTYCVADLLWFFMLIVVHELHRLSVDSAVGAVGPQSCGSGGPQSGAQVAQSNRSTQLRRRVRRLRRRRPRAPRLRNQRTSPLAFSSSNSII